MNRRSSRSILRAQTINLGLVVSLGILGCGEARQAPTDIEQDPNATVGTLKVLLASYEDHAVTSYRLMKDNGEDVGLNFGSEAPRLRVGERIAVRGRLEGDRIEVTGYELVQRRIGDTQQALLTGAAATRTLRVAAISLSSNMTKANFAKRVFMDADSPSAFYKENSYGAWTFTGDSYGPYTIATTSCADTVLYTIASEAAAAAKADGFDVNNYDNVMYYMPPSQNCSWGGVAEVGTNEVRGFWNAKHSWYNGSGCVVLAQELGHNYGLLHSHKCTASPYVNGASYGGTSCGGYNEYGDVYTPMGGGCGHFNSPEMGTMRFTTGCNTLDVTNSGTFEIGPLEQRCAGPQVIRVPTGTTANKGPQYIYVEYRLGSGTIGSDTKSPKGLHFYASAEYGGAPTGIVSDIHDLDYAVDPFQIHDPIGTASGSWTEPVSKATFTLQTIGQTATVQVTVPNGTGTVQCVGGGTPPAAPMCGGDAGVPPTPDAGTGGTGGGPADASTGKDAAGGGAGTAGAAGAGGTAGTGGTAGAGGTAGTGGAGTGGTGGTAGTAGSGGGGTAGKGGAGTGGTGGTGGSTGGTAGSGTAGSAGATGGSSGAGGSAGTGTAGKGGSGGGTGGSTGGSTGGTTPPADGGCSCSIPGGRKSTSSPAMLLGLAALIPALRRRRSRGSN